MLKEFAPLNELHDEVDLELGLEAEVETHREGMIHLLENLLLQESRFDLVGLEDHVLAEALHRVDLLRVVLLDKEDRAECTLSEDLEDCEVCQSCCSRRLRGLVCLFWRYVFKD